MRPWLAPALVLLASAAAAQPAQDPPATSAPPASAYGVTDDRPGTVAAPNRRPATAEDIQALQRSAGRGNRGAGKRAKANNAAYGSGGGMQPHPKARRRPR